MTMSSTLIQGSGVNPLFSGGMELRGPASAAPGVVTTGGFAGLIRSSSAASGAAQVDVASGIDPATNAVPLLTGVVIENILRVDVNTLDTNAPISTSDVEAGFEASAHVYGTVEIVNNTGQYSIRSIAPGDANGDFRVDATDLTAARVNFNQPTVLPRWAGGDWTQDGRVDAADLLAASPFLNAGNIDSGYMEASDLLAGTVVYHAATGRILLGVDAGFIIDSFKLDSASGLFSAAAPNLPGLSDFTTDSDSRIAQNFFAVPLTAGLFDLGAVAPAGLTEELLRADLSAVFGTTGAANQLPALVYVAIPEPTALTLLTLPALALIRRARR
jgi:hypothetical protein